MAPGTSKPTDADEESSSESKSGSEGRNGDVNPNPPHSSSSHTPGTITPPDGGWGWVVVMSSFMISVFVDGVCFSVGVFFNAFKDTFHSSKSETAWVGSVLNGTYLSVGPIVGACVHRFGCRRVAMAGSVFAAASFFLSTFSTSMPLLVATYGMLGGFGFGFMYLPAIIMVGFYFEKRRALATGIACCGSGIGAFLFAPMCTYLQEVYTWKGAVWILSAIVLNGLVVSVFYRPLDVNRTTSRGERLQVVENGESVPEQKLKLIVTEGNDYDSGDGAQMDDPGHATGTRVSEGDTMKHTADMTSSCSIVGHGEDNVNELAVGDYSADDITVQTLSASDIPSITAQETDDSLFRGGGNSWEITVDVKDVEMAAETEREKECRAKSKSEEVVNKLIKTVTPQIHTVQSVESKTFMSDFRLKESGNAVARMAFSHDIIAPTRVNQRATSKHNSRRHHHQQQHNSSRHQYGPNHHLGVQDPLRRRDIFYSGSLARIPEFQSSESMADYRRRIVKVELMKTKTGGSEDDDEDDTDDIDDDEEDGKRRKSCMRRMVVEPLRQVFDVSLLKSPTFAIYGIACFLSMLGFFVPFIYLPTLCTDLGIDATKASFLISVIGIANTVGRIAVGFVSDQPWADCLLINNVALVIGGLATCAVPFLDVYPLFALYTFLFGTCIAVFISLRTIIMVELMGLEKLTNAFGLVILFQGISTFIGAPIAGLLSDFTGDYNSSFYVAGTFLGLGGVICLPLRHISRWEQERRRKKHDEAYVLAVRRTEKSK